MKRTPLNAELWECQAFTNGSYGKEPASGYLRRNYASWRSYLSSVLRGSPEPQISDPVEETPKPESRITSLGSSSPPLNEGDRVRVRSLDEINGMLDKDGFTKGCKFLKQMAAFCGNEYQIVRKVDRFYDEARARLCKAKNIVLLDTVYCDGSQVGGCNRMCLLFWRTEWLEKVD